MSPSPFQPRNTHFDGNNLNCEKKPSEKKEIRSPNFHCPFFLQENFSEKLKGKKIAREIGTTMKNEFKRTNKVTKTIFSWQMFFPVDLLLSSSSFPNHHHNQPSFLLSFFVMWKERETNNSISYFFSFPVSPIQL